MSKINKNPLLRRIWAEIGKQFKDRDKYCIDLRIDKPYMETGQWVTIEAKTIGLPDPAKRSLLFESRDIKSDEEISRMTKGFVEVLTWANGAMVKNALNINRQ